MRLLLALLLLLSISGYGQNPSPRFDCASNFTGNDFWENRVEDIYKKSIKKVKSDYSKSLDKAGIKGISSYYENRMEIFMDLVMDGDLIIEGELYDYVRGVLDEILYCSGIENEIYLFLVRDNSPNAFNMGDDHLFIHLGLLKNITSEDQLAFVLAHELGHNELDHFEHRTFEYARMITDESLNAKIKEIQKSSYRQVTALNEVMLPWLLANRSSSRDAEYEADDFGFECIEACGYSKTLAAGVFDILERRPIDDTTHKDLTALLRLDEIDMDFSFALDFNTESSLGMTQRSRMSDTMSDMLRTHPFGEERKAIALENSEEIDSLADTLTRDMEYYQALANREIIIDNIYDGHLDYVIFSCLELIETGKQDAFVEMILPFAFSYLGYQKIKRQMGKNIRIQSVYFGQPFNDLVYFLRELTPDQCFAIADNLTQINHQKYGADITNPTMAILDATSDKEQEFYQRLESERNKNKNYYVLSILEKIESELY